MIRTRKLITLASDNAREGLKVEADQSHAKRKTGLSFCGFGLTLLLLIACVFFGFEPAVYGQVVGASLQGRVLDSSGRVIKGAKVRALDTQTGVSTPTQTNSVGLFHLTNLAVGGPYTVTISAPGFKTEVRSGITLALNQAGRMTVVLQVGTVNQQVMVRANVSQLNTTDGELGTTISHTLVKNLPLLDRNVYSLMFLAPGTTGSVGDAYNAFNLSVNGGRPGSADILIDGIPSAPTLSNPINGFAVFPTLNGVQEVKMLTSNYSAEYGRSGGGIVNMIMSSGTNHFHGTAFEFYRNSVLDANTYFNNLHGHPLGGFGQHQFGGSLGGPVWIPKVYNGKNKTFFFVSYEGYRIGATNNFTTTVPTAAERTGDFSALLNQNGQPITIYNPSTTTTTAPFKRQPFPGNIIPPQDIDPVAKKILNYYPMPNTQGTIAGQNNYFATAPAEQHRNTIDMKVDEHFNDRNHLFVRYSHRNQTQPASLFFPTADQAAEPGNTQTQLSNSVSVDDTFTVSQNDVLEFRYGFSRIAIDFIANGDGFNSSAELGFPSGFAQKAVFPTISVAGYATLGNAGANVTRNDIYSTSIFAVNNTMTLGKNLLQYGGEFRWLGAGGQLSSAASAVFNFSKQLTQGPNPNAATATAGDAFATFLLGLGNGTETTANANSKKRSQYLGAYIQDNWTATNRLTLNMGIRYDLDLPMYAVDNNFSVFDPNAQQNQLDAETGLSGLHGGLIYPNVNGVPRRIQQPQWLNFSPRFGFAYKVDNKTVVRGGYGIFFGASYSAADVNQGGTGFGATTSYLGSENGLTPSTYLSNPFPNGLNQPTGSSLGVLTGLGSGLAAEQLGDNTVPYTENWNFDIQRQLPFKVLVDAAYVGSHGVHLNKAGLTNWNANQLTTADLALGTQLQQLVPNPFYGIITTGPESGKTIARNFLVTNFPQFTSVSYLFPTGAYEDYSSFQLKVTKRLSHGLTGILAYTDQKQIDDYSNISNLGGSAAIQNIYDLKAERSISANNIAQILSIAAVYSVPFGHGQEWGAHWNRITNAFLGGWQLNTIISAQSGDPLSINTVNTSQAKNNGLRPNLTGVSPNMPGSIKSRLNGYINPAAFSQPAPFTFGNAPRVFGNLRGPAYHDIDLSLFKNFHVAGRVMAQIRAESSNVLNQVVFGDPNTNFSAQQFGVITYQANSPRALQFGVQLSY